MNKKIILPAFFVMALLQIYIPASMIFSAENVLTEGVEFKFKTAPLDPTDPFRGKYVNLSFEATSHRVANAVDWNYGESVFVTLGTDEKGFAKIQSLSKEKPDDTDHYVKASINYVSGDSSAHVSVDYPFNRFYMEESKAYDAEQAYNESARDSMQTTYALVAVKKGQAVIKEVFINGIPIREAAMQRRENLE